MNKEYPQDFELRDGTLATSHLEEYDDEISLKDLVLALWRSRGRIVLLSLVAMVLIFAVGGTTYLFQEKQVVARLGFKLQFAGADRGEYPNGMQFSAADLLSLPVVEKVYNENDLKRFMEFSDFKASLAVYQTNDKLRFLEYEYGQKLSEKNLSVENRQRLEAEFLEKKRNLMAPVYTLAFMQQQRAVFLPADLTAKVLNDILLAWADYAERVKGANEYQIELVSRNVIDKDVIQSEDYLVSTDMLRRTIDRVSQDIAKISELPGAKTVEVGDKGVSLSDLRYRIKDLDQFKLSPLFGLIRQAGVSKHPEFTLGYLQNRLFEINLKMEEASADMNVYESSLSQYGSRSVVAGLPADNGAGGLSNPPQSRLLENVPAMIPQFGSSFLDSLMQMAQENADAAFRQDITKKMIDSGLEKVRLEFEAKYYQDMYDRIKDTLTTDRKPATEMEKKFQAVAVDRIAKTQEQVYDSLMQTIDQLDTMHQKLSKYNLNPQAVLYSITMPVVMYTERPISTKKLLIYVILALFIAEGAILVGVLAAGGLRQNSFRPRS